MTAHEPVMLSESLGLLAVHCGGTYIDATLGGGGHTRALCEATGHGGRVVSLDRDVAAIDSAREALGADYPFLAVEQADFANMAQVALQLIPEGADGVLMDLGISSMQLDPESGRGFSFLGDEPLDMRMDTTRGETAAELLAHIDEDQLSRSLRKYGDERYSRRIARAIAAAREEAAIETTAELAELVREAIPASGDRIDPATRTFMALRIVVNHELDSLRLGLAGAVEALKPGGRLVVLAYHSGEDRLVKRFLRAEAKGCTCPDDIPVCICGGIPTLRILTRRPLRPSDEEVQSNPRARSCKLRAAERLERGESNGNS